MLSTTARRVCYAVLVVACACALASTFSQYWIKGRLVGYNRPQFQAGLWQYESCPPLHSNVSTGCEKDRFSRSLCSNYTRSGGCFYESLQAVEASAVLCSAGGGISVLVMMVGVFTGITVIFPVFICSVVSGRTPFNCVVYLRFAYDILLPGLFGMIATIVFAGRLGDDSFVEDNTYLAPFYIFTLSWCLQFAVFLYFIFNICGRSSTKGEPLLP